MTSWVAGFFDGMRTMMRGKKGAAAAILIGLAMIFFVGMVYVVMTEPFDAVMSKFNESMAGTPYQGTYTKLQTNWTLWPIIVTITIILWVVLNGLKRQPDEFGGL